MPIPIPKCEKCETEMILKQKGPDKFWGCPNWKQCKGRTRPYDGVDNPKPGPDSSSSETLGRIELKLDFIIDYIQTMKQAKKVVPSQSQGMQSLKEIIGEDEINPKDIPF